jgi:Double-GTPase 2
MKQEIKIAMLGASGVGKTSLLTAMYEQFAETIGKTNLQLTPDYESAALLQERLGELKSLLDNFEAKGGVNGSTNERSFIFDLGKKASQPFITLNFHDFPGNYLQSGATPENKKFVKDLLTESAIIIITIDTPALMERGGKWHDSINRPQQIANLFQTVYRDIQSPKLVILVPVRCETYLRDSKTANLLTKNIKEKYSQLLNFLSSPSLLPWVVAIITPVQTVGNVVFSNIEEVDGQARFYFRKNSHDAEYSPKNSDQPLRYILRFLLKLQIQHKNKEWGIFASFRELFGWNIYLKEAASKAAIECKTDDGFAVLQGENWLTIE